MEVFIISKILVFIFDDMTDFEVTFAMHLLSTESNKEIITISYDDKVIRGKSGLSYIPSKKISDLSFDDIDGLIIPGGWYGDNRPELTTLIQGLNKRGKLLAGICGAGTVLLAKAGVLNNVKYTTPVITWGNKHKEIFGETDPFPRENFHLDRFVRDNNIITAQGLAFIDFAIEICDWFNLFEKNGDKEKFIRTFKG